MSQPVTIPRFGGLNLPDDPEEVGFAGAIDLLNVDFDRRGRLRTRNGYTVFTDAEGTNRYDSMSMFGTSVLAGAGNRLELIDNTGAIVATSAAPTASPHQAVTFGGASGTAMYIANGTDQVRKLAGTTFSTPAGLAAVTDKYLAVQTPDNRLVAAKGNRVYFSAPGNPESFNRADPGGDWVDVTPGDGESISGMVAWNHLLFVFKPSKFAVFYGNSEDGTGGSIFNYRVIDAGVGASSIATAIAATPAGVVFGHYSGIYKTAGDTPVLISEALDPLFRFQVPEGYQGEAFLRVVQSMSYSDRRVYIAIRSFPSATYEMLVFDIDSGTWTVWDLLASVVLADPVTSTVYFAYGTGLKHIGAVASTATDDAGTPITWRHRTGYSDMEQATVKRVRELAVWGSGTVTAKVAVDHGSLDTGSALTLGTSPAVLETRQRVARRGQLFSVELSGSGQATVSRVVLYVADQRLPGVG